MGKEERRTRQRAERHAAILSAARDLAETEGWEAVTTRRLADRIEYSQPVLYDHFPGKAAIIAAVAREGFADLAADLDRRAASATGPAEAVRAAVEVYLAFARTRPATYAAMFTLPTDLRFAADDTPEELHRAFHALRGALATATGEDELELRTELLWSTLHGLATLTARGRLPRASEDARVALLLRGPGPGPGARSDRETAP